MKNPAATLSRRLGRLRRTTILWKALLVLALPLLYQAIFIALLMRRETEMADAQRLAMHTKDVMAQTDHVFLLLVSQHSDARAFILTGSNVFEQQVRDSRNNLESALVRLKGLVHDNRRQQERVERIARLVQAEIDLQEDVIAKVKTDSSGDAAEAVRTMKGKKSMDDIEKEIEDFRGYEERLDGERLAKVRRTGAEQTWLLAGGMVVNLGIGGLAAAMFSREISGRILALAENTRRIGRREKLPPVAAGGDEIHELDVQFHQLAEDLEVAGFKERVYQQILERRASELTRANQDLSYKNQEIEMFVYSVSHDLRSPLVNLQGFSRELGLAREDLQKLLAGNFAAEARDAAKELIECDIAESIHYIQTAVARLSAIIDALLRLSRAGRVEYHPQWVELNPVVSRILEAMQGTIAQKNVLISVHKLPRVWADPTAIEQIFANVIGNAVNYLDASRPGTVEIGAVEGEIEHLDKSVGYYVKDNGLGIPAAYLPKLFAIFQRLHGEIAPGEGVGLALVRRMVERHGGKVWAESVEGAGSTFFLAFPAGHGFSPMPGVAPRKESVGMGRGNVR